MTMMPTLNRKIVLQERQTAVDGAGGFDVTWTDVGTLWASIDTRRGAERFVGGRIVSSVSYVFTVRGAPVDAPSRPKPDQRFVDGERIFSILAVAEDDRHGRYLTCWTEEGTRE